MKKDVKIDYLFLDLQSCERCTGTDKVLEEVINMICPILELADFEVTYRKIEISTIEIAEKYRFLSSPTIRVNDLDIYSLVTETNCDCCSNISGTDVTCRVFKHEEQLYEVPHKGMLIEAILKAIFAQDGKIQETQYILPQNLKSFFEGKASKSKPCSCNEGCC